MKLTSLISKIRHKHQLVVLVFFFTQAHGQNLIPNGSFESTIYSISPKDYMLPVYYEVGWGDYSSALIYSGDSFNYDGCIYTEVTVYSPQGKDYRTYIENKLTKPLQRGESCYFKMMIRAKGKYITNRIGVLFSNDSINTKEYQVINKQPYIEYLLDKKLKNKKRWLLFEGNFIARGGEQFVIIGNFYDDKNTKIKIRSSSKNKFGQSYWSIDACELYGSYSDSESVFMH
ncbi:MAG: hypothetical protein D4R43_01280 [Sphingobacteriales bacterium]|nr:MAG: hypothetical protein D4R43_01280 [Sphingobacteriales bacterium]